MPRHCVQAFGGRLERPSYHSPFEVLGDSRLTIEVQKKSVTKSEEKLTFFTLFSPQVCIVAKIAHALGLQCHLHTPTGELSKEIQVRKKKQKVFSTT